MVAFIAAVSGGSVRIAASEPIDALLMEMAPPPSDRVLDAIPELGRKLLALRSYVRARSTIAKRWSWTEAEIKAFQGSPAQQDLLAEVAAIGAHFTEANPGYEIYANTKVRSLDVQLDHWNDNDSVGAAADEILAEWESTFGETSDPSTKPDLRQMQAWLSAFRGTKRSNLAAPGLTAHGQAHAIDFQIMKDGEIIAGADSSQIETVWRAEGWDEKLKQSMDAAGPSFTGPLQSPDEPWHYHYDPEEQSDAE